jgi:hypothetical protein
VTVIVSSGGSPTTRRAPKGSVDLREASGMVGSVREAAHRRDGEVGWRLWLGSDFAEIQHRGSHIYRGFDTNV